MPPPRRSPGPHSCWRPYDGEKGKTGYVWNERRIAFSEHISQWCYIEMDMAFAWNWWRPCSWPHLPGSSSGCTHPGGHTSFICAITCQLSRMSLNLDSHDRPPAWESVKRKTS